MSAPGSFLHDVLIHLGNFATTNGIGQSDVYVRITLADGTIFTTQALKIAPPSVMNGFGMIEAGIAKTGEAWVVREAHVLKVEFELDPEQRRPIGLHTEIASP